MLTFWEKLNLQPYSGEKDLNYCVVFPQVPSVDLTVQRFFEELSQIYTSCGLGKHKLHTDGLSRAFTFGKTFFFPFSL